MSDTPLGYSRDGNVVTLKMTVQDWQQMLIVLGYGVAANSTRGDFDQDRLLALVNRLHAGNPDFRPYAVRDVTDPLKQ